MSLFQKSVEKKYLSDLDFELIDKKYADFQNYFANPEIQENIRNSKEEQFQEGFLRELFVKILGYTLNPEPNFNLTTELKNLANSKKADGAILTRGHAPLVEPYATAVIELKGTDTTDLDKIEAQAFGYKNHHPKCKYVITSNFEKLRFYIQNAVDHIDFDLFNQTREQFSLMWLCLAKDNLLADLPLKIKESSVLQEENITKKLYADYSKFREAVYNNLVKNNIENNNGLQPIADKATLFQKTQKLLDRFLFILFAEDRLLVPPNSISQIIEKWKDDVDFGETKPLYDTFKKYFHVLNVGRPKSGNRQEIYAYNGGLFKPDEILDNITIDDDILYEHTLRLSKYDFETDVDVNILGHIFEHSLASATEHAPSSASVRKRDGIFYTPKYITRYIVENTVGKLCEEKRAQRGIFDEEYAKGRKNRKKELIKSLDKKLNDYRDWLLNLTILDPACGSGAFLNQALEFLINEHRKIDELRGQLLGGAIIFSDITTDILEKNIYGVDLNEESVEIAKLSLWLRTAQKGRKLNTLSNNIKCGNSLIDNPEIAGEKAFNWQKEFPDIFRKKEKKAWHITTATHNSRYSQRMFDCHVELGEAEWLDEQDELVITRTIKEIAIADKLNILAYNICGDHMHLLLVCEEEELPGIVGKLKSVSAKNRNRERGYTVAATSGTRGHAPLSNVPSADALSAESGTGSGSSGISSDSDTGSGTPGSGTDSGTGNAPVRGTTQRPVWTQKFGKVEVDTDEYLDNAIAYIRNNRIKHGLAHKGACPLDKACPLVQIIGTMVCSREHAFRTEYIGGFDVVIGNPPYVQLQSMGEMSEKLSKCGYETFHKGADLYCLFTERGFKLLKPGGLQSFIMPNKWMLVEYGKPLRKFLAKTGLRQILNFGDIQFFEDALTIVCIFVTQNSSGACPTAVQVLSLNKKTYSGDFLSEVKNGIYAYPSSKFGDAVWSIQPYRDALKLETMKQNGTELKDLPISINYGIKTGFNDAFFIDEDTRSQLITVDPKSAELIKPMVRGRDISAYGFSGFEYLINVHNGIKENNPPLLPISIDDFPAIKNHLNAFYPMLEKRGDKGETPYNLRNCAYLEEFSRPKIIYPNMTSVFPFMYDESGFFSNDKSFILTSKDESFSLLFLTAVLNSSLAKLWIWYNCPELQGGTREIRKVYFEHFPVPKADEEQTARLAQFASERTKQTRQLQTTVDGFKKFLKAKTETGKLNNKLENWHHLTFNEFLKELNNGSRPIAGSRPVVGSRPVAGSRPGAGTLTKTEEFEWMQLFEVKKAEAQTLQSEIGKTDREIDRLVYGLYGLEEEEIKIVEAQA